MEEQQQQQQPFFFNMAIAAADATITITTTVWGRPSRSRRPKWAAAVVGLLGFVDGEV